MINSELLFKSALDLSRLLSKGQTNSVKLVNAALDQIERHNNGGKKLNALIAVAPREKALDRAAELDRERALYGLPIVLKVCVHRTRGKCSADFSNFCFFSLRIRLLRIRRLECRRVVVRPCLRH
jgi:hypothetical protein